MINNGISIIICVHNGERRIVPVLDSIYAQKLPSDFSCEIVIVNNASTDSTTQVILKYREEVKSNIPLRLLHEPKPGKANALIKGYDEAQYELMLLCDDDNWLQPEYLKIVCEIYSKYPDIGLLGGYGKALFNANEEPTWFKKWEYLYVCGKHHKQNGFLKPLDFSIWGAGSVLRKTMWNFLRQSGFSFYNSKSKGKAMSEDAELSMAISFTAHRLYFDDRLWFTHDLRGRVTWENMLTQQSWNGKTNTILYMYRLAVDHVNEKNPWIKWLVIKKILGLIWSVFKSSMKPRNKPRSIYMLNILKELYFNRKEYELQAVRSFQWIKKIHMAKPLDQNDKLFC